MESRSRSSRQIQVRNPEDYPPFLKFVLSLVGINEVPLVVGSAAYLQFKFPGDVDVFEQVVIKGTRDQALDYYADQFSTIAQELIITQKGIFFADFKAGLDNRYDILVGPQTTQKEMLQIANQLYQQKLVTNLELSILREVGQRTQNGGKWEDFKEFLRSLKVVRWSLAEIIQGWKYLPLSKKLTLRDALAMDTAVKLDVISRIESRFQSVETFYDLRYEDATGTYSFYNLGSYFQNLSEDISKYGRAKHYNPLKVMKRLWALGRVIDCQKLITDLNPLFQSDPAALNQVIADIEVLEILIKQRQGQLDIIFLEVIRFKKRIHNHLELDQYSAFLPLVKEVYPLWTRWRRDQIYSRETLLTILGKISDYLKPIIQQKSAAFLAEFKRRSVICDTGQVKLHI